MNLTIYTESTGEIVRLVSCPDDEAFLQVQEGEGYVEGHYDSRSFYWNGAGMVAFPAQPTSDHVWDWATKTWEADLAGAKVRVALDIDLERDRRIVAPILVYDGVRLDADARALENLKSKLAETSSRLALKRPYTAEELVWRDADNQLHYFPDMQTYKNWLDGFAIEFGSRGTAAYAWSWQRKAELDAAMTLEGVLAIDLTS